MNRKVFSGLEKLPTGTASEKITEGCIVLEGGAFRGLYTSGVLDALMKAGINMQSTIGVSAGAMNGMNYVSGQIGRTARLNLTYRHDSRYVGLKAMRHNKGVIGFDFIFHDVNDEGESFCEERFFDPRKRFVAVATDCLTGKPHYFEKEQKDIIYHAVRASASMPYVSKMVTIDGVPYLDGGCSDKIPFHWAMEQGYKKIILVRTRPMDYRKNIRENSSLEKRLYRSYPAFAEALAGSNENYNRLCEEIIELSAGKKMYVIAPSRPFQISRLEGDVEKLGRLYSLGYHDVKKQIHEIRDFLNSPSISE